LTSLKQGGEDLKLKKAVEKIEEIELNWKNNFFEFEYSALNYTQPEKNQYAYMLEGIDKEWYYSKTKRFGRYTNIPGGKYTLRIKGSNNDGIWNFHEAGTVGPAAKAETDGKKVLGLNGKDYHINYVAAEREGR